jgi:hypothetical protein
MEEKAKKRMVIRLIVLDLMHEIVGMYCGQSRSFRAQTSTAQTHRLKGNSHGSLHFRFRKIALRTDGNANG